MTIAILGAMNEEISAIVAALESPQIIERGSRQYYRGVLEGHEVVVTISRIGKVASASTATTLLDHFNARMVLFTGVAGGIAPHLKIGDVVVASSLLQHDFDASAVLNIKKFEIPFLGAVSIKADPTLQEYAVRAIKRFFVQDPAHAHSSVYQGVIASGDQFIHGPTMRHALLKEIPELLAVEMEGAAVAQVCHEWKIPFAVIRSISDNADSSSPSDFHQFITKVAAPLSSGVLRAVLKEIAHQ